MPFATLSAASGGWHGTISVACAGDTNGDGYADLVIGSVDLNETGAMDIYLSGSSGINPTPIHFGAAPSQWLDGKTVSGAGDVNGDGYGDIVVGVDGMAYVFIGSTSGPTSTPIGLPNPNSFAYYGYPVSGAGDTNGDNFDDVIIGGPNPDAWLYPGAMGGVSGTNYTVFGCPASCGVFGYPVATLQLRGGDPTDRKSYGTMRRDWRCSAERRPQARRHSMREGDAHELVIEPEPHPG